MILLLLVLAAPPPPSSAYVLVKNQGVSQGYARTINCSGSGVTCAVNTTTAEATLTVSASGSSDAGSSIAIPNCAAGYVLDADGGVLYCINTIANATLAATATALAANPTDCSSNQYATAIAANGNLTCATVTGGQVSGAVATATALAADPTDCSAGQYATSIAASGNLGCATITGGQISGAVGTATALAANPADCSTGQYATTIAASGDLTCAAVATSQLSGTITNAQLASLYSGVGACAANTWASTLVSNSAPTCTQPDFNNIHGQVTDAQLDGGYSGYGACGSHQWASTLSRNASPTCTQPATIDLSGQISDAQLDGGYSGVGACGTHQWASTLSRNASPTCTQPNYTDLAGCEPGQGVAGAVQYNSSSCEGGITNLTSDGTNPIVTGISDHPATPTANVVHYDQRSSAAFPPIPFVRDSFMGTPIPVGILATFNEGMGTNWVWSCVRKPPGGAGVVGIGVSAPTASSWTSTSGSLQSATLISRQFFVVGGTVAGFGVSSLLQNSPSTLSFGNGFIWWARMAMHTTTTHSSYFMGLMGGTTYTTQQPSQLGGTIYFGCDDNGDGGNSNLHICSNDTTGLANCTDLGASFSCRNNDGIYDLWLAAAPGFVLPDAGLGVSYRIDNVDAGTFAVGTTSNDLPDSGQSLSWLLEVNQGDAGGTGPVPYFMGSCIANNL